MSKAFEMISESLNEIIEDLEKNDGKNLNRETLSIKLEENKKIPDKKIYVSSNENFFESVINS